MLAGNTKKFVGKSNLCCRNVKRYLLGSGEKLFVDVVVMNEGEDAFESVFDMKVPAGINYVKIERVDGERDVLVQCSAPSFVNNNTLHCDIGNPLPKEKTVSGYQCSYTLVKNKRFTLTNNIFFYSVEVSFAIIIIGNRLQLSYHFHRSFDRRASLLKELGPLEA